MQSWSLSSAYHGALFAQKAFLAFLGLGFPVVNNKTIYVDVWPGPPKGQRNKNRKFEVGSEMQFMLMPRLEHRHMWSILQRILRVSNIQVCGDDAVDAIVGLDHLAFARQRNTLHYQNHKWLFSDLFEFQISQTFGVFGAERPLHVCLSEGSDDSSLALAFQLFTDSYKLLADIAANAPGLAGELELVRSTITAERHPLLSGGFM